MFVESLFSCIVVECALANSSRCFRSDLSHAWLFFRQELTRTQQQQFEQQQQFQAQQQQQQFEQQQQFQAQQQQFEQQQFQAQQQQQFEQQQQQQFQPQQQFEQQQQQQFQPQQQPPSERNQSYQPPPSEPQQPSQQNYQPRNNKVRVHSRWFSNPLCVVKMVHCVSGGDEPGSGASSALTEAVLYMTYETLLTQHLESIGAFLPLNNTPAPATNTSAML